MRRFVGSVLVGLGGLLLVLAIGLPLYVVPAVTKLPYDMQPCPPAGQEQPDGCLKPSVAEATGVTFLQITDQGLFIRNGTLRSITEVIPQAKKTADWQKENKTGRLDDNAIIWDVYNNNIWVEGDGVSISKYSTELALDRVSGAAINWEGQWLDESNLGSNVPAKNISYSGQVYKFPFGTEKVTYSIYDRDLRKALPAEFVEVTTVNGLEAYHFKQTIDSQEVQNVSAESIAALRNTFAPTSTSAKLLYSNTREVWVDPVTGAYLDVREQPFKRLVPADGTDGETTLLKGDFRYTAETVKNSVASAEANHTKLELVSVYAPIGLGVLGLIFFVVGLLMVRGGAKPAREPGAWDEALPEPRHRLRGDSATMEAPAVGSGQNWSGQQ